MIPVCKPFWGAEEEAAMLRVARSGRLIQGNEVRLFEDAVREFVGVEYAVACSSGTTALHLALLACGVKAGDEVLVPAFTFVATANAVLMCGGKPVLHDIRLDNFGINYFGNTPPHKIVITVHPFGHPHPLGADHPVIEDAACALGSFKLTGRAAILSFHATKVITTGEGGMVLTNDAEVAGNARRLRDQKHGHGLAYNYRMTEMQGAIGQEQMKKLPTILERRWDIAVAYDHALDGKIVARIPPAGGNYQSYVLLLDEGIKRECVVRDLAARGIEALPGTQYLGDMPHLSDGRDYPNARAAGERAMRIPCYPGMTDEEVGKVIEATLEVLG